MNLEKKEHRSYLKQNAQIRYLPVLSNHPECIKQSIKTGVEKRLSAISSNEKCFKQEVGKYEEALGQAGHQGKLQYQQGQPGGAKKNRQRKVIWFNPPYSESVATNMGKLFLGAVGKHFGQDPRLKKLFNLNNVKVSPSCGQSLKQEIHSHNRATLRSYRQGSARQEEASMDRRCSCRRATREQVKCPLQG